MHVPYRQCHGWRNWLSRVALIHSHCITRRSYIPLRLLLPLFIVVSIPPLSRDWGVALTGRIKKISSANKPRGLNQTASAGWLTAVIAHPVLFCAWYSFSPGSVQVPQLFQSNSRAISRQEGHAFSPFKFVGHKPDPTWRRCTVEVMSSNDNTQHGTCSVYVTNLHALKCKHNRYTNSYIVLMTNEMHSSYNQFLFHSFLSALHVSND